jgi:hypothetical protein
MSIIVAKTKKKLNNQLSSIPILYTSYYICQNKYIGFCKDAKFVSCPVCDKLHINFIKNYHLSAIGNSEIKVICIYKYDIHEKSILIRSSNGEIVNLIPPIIHDNDEYQRWILKKDDGKIFVRLKLNQNNLRLIHNYKQNCRGSYFMNDIYEISYKLNIPEFFNIPKYGDIILTNDGEYMKSVNIRLYGLKYRLNYDNGYPYKTEKSFSLYDKYLTHKNYNLYIEFEIILSSNGFECFNLNIDKIITPNRSILKYDGNRSIQERCYLDFEGSIDPKRIIKYSLIDFKNGKCLHESLYCDQIILLHKYYCSNDYKLILTIEKIDIARFEDKYEIKNYDDNFL